jgi:hypothetical protein
MELLRLTFDHTISPRQAEEAIDQLMESGSTPLPDGHCSKRGCSGQVHRRIDPLGTLGGYALSPYCPLCNTRYRHTPGDLWLPLETVLDL